MKYIPTLVILLLAGPVSAQTEFPGFLQGTWKMENKETYEHWDRLNENTMKGFSYTLKDGKIVVSEYLDLDRKRNEVTYTATVLNQNQGKGISFRLAKADSSFVFENPSHDFPKKIVYRKLTDHDVLVQVSGGNRETLSYKMQKQDIKLQVEDGSASNPNYDIALAEKLGADDYGMKNYIFVILRTGSNKTTDKTFISNAFRGHLDNINKLVEQNKLIVAGPLGQNVNNYRGIFILNNVASFEEANELLQTDPAIKAGLLDAELYNWYGSAALPQYLEFSDRVWKLMP